MRVGMVIVLIGVAILAAGRGGTAAPVEPLIVGWESIFTVSWEPAQRRGRTVVQGIVANKSPYTIVDLQLLLDALDANGRILAQQVAWSPGTLPAFSQVSFEIAVRQPASSYRVRVLAFDRVESPSRAP